MKLHKRIVASIREALHPDRIHRVQARHALETHYVERADFGECLSDDSRLDQLVGIIKNTPEAGRATVRHYAGYSRAQLMQDLFVLSELGVRRGEGFFVEFGASDGVALNNTWLLEKCLGWKGILAEPAQCWHAALRVNRQCVIETDCIWSKTGDLLDFDEVSTAELSTISQFCQADSHALARSESRRYQVSTISLNDLLHRHHAPTELDYLSIDTEGSEFAILREFDFDRYRFKVITCEHNHTPTREKIHQLLLAAGYKRKLEKLSRFDDWYVRCD